MMRQIYIYIMVAISVLSTGCQSYKIIPDGELAHIFHDAFLTNAYITTGKLSLDSLNIYEPIFESYGYTIEDVQYTIGNFSKRKSARLGDVVERAILLLESKGMQYEWDVAILDTIGVKSQRLQVQTIFNMKKIEVTKHRDTTKLLRNVSNIDRGEYKLSFDYLIDSLDQNVGAYRTVSWFEIDGNLTPDSTLRRYEETVRYLQRNREMTHNQTLKATREYDRLVMQLVDIMGKEETPHLTVENVVVEYTPTSDVAERLQFEQMVKINIFSDDLLPPPAPPKDSL